MVMAKIKIIKHHTHYANGGVYDVDEARANYLVRVGVAEYAETEKKEISSAKEKKEIQKPAEKRRIKKPGS